MMSSLILVTILSCFKWFLILAILIWLYRNLSLPTLPWIAAHYGINAVCGLCVSLSKPLFDSFESYLQRIHDIGVTLASLSAYTLLLDSIIDLVIVLLILSEIAYLITKPYPETKARVITYLSSLHKHVSLLGTVLVLLTLVKPVFMLIFWIDHR